MAVTTFSSLTASKALGAVDTTYNYLGLSTVRGRTRKETSRKHGFVSSFFRLILH